MAFALTGYKAWGIETSKAVSPECIQYLEVTITAANTDVAVDVGTTGGTFWTAVGATAIPAAAKKYMYDFCSKADYSLPTLGTHNGLWSRAAAAASTTYIETAGTVTNSRDITFNSGTAPTAATIVWAWKMKAGSATVTVNS